MESSIELVFSVNIAVRTWKSSKYTAGNKVGRSLFDSQEEKHMNAMSCIFESYKIECYRNAHQKVFRYTIGKT
jgi:hypothetical protein